MRYKLIILALFIVTGCNELKEGKLETKTKTSIVQAHSVIQTELKEYNNLTKYDCRFLNNHGTLGIGLIMWEFDCSEWTTFYKNDLMSELYGTYNFCSTSSGICPLFYKPDYGIMHFVVTDSTDFYYQLSLGANNIVYMKKNSNFIYVKWEEFFLNKVVSVSQNNSNNTYKVIEYDGDFLIVFDDVSNQNKRIRWKAEDQLLIDINLLK